MWDRPRLLNWLANLLFSLAVVLMLYGLLFAIVHLPIFPIREVRVEGQVTNISRQQVKQIVDMHLKGNFFTLDLVQTRDAFEQLPWARNVSVRRAWPDTLNVEIKEHVALARWGEDALVNTYGELFNAATDEQLPLFTGADEDVEKVTRHYAEFSKVLNSVDIKIEHVNLSARQAWEIKTDKNLFIALGRVDMNARLERFTAGYVAVLKKLNKEIKYADLRYPNGFAIRKPKKLSMQVLPLVSEKTHSMA